MVKMLVTVIGGLSLLISYTLADTKDTEIPGYVMVSRKEILQVMEYVSKMEEVMQAQNIALIELEKKFALAIAMKQCTGLPMTGK